jgi:hypothetical protein
LKNFEQTLVEKPAAQSPLRREPFFQVVVHLVNFSQPDFDFLFSTGPWLKNFQQTLIENFSARS